MKINKFITKSPIFPILLASDSISKKLGEELRVFDLTITEALILVSVFIESRDARPSELANSLQVSRSRLSQGLKKLLNDGYLTRKIESKDARFMNIQITSQGQVIAPKLIKVFDKESNTIEAKLGVKKAEGLAENLLQYLKE